MKFYIARDESGHRYLHHRQDEAKAQDKNFEKIDIPTSMQELKEFVQGLYSEIDARAETFERSFDEGARRVINSLPEQPSYATTSVRFEDEFDNMPLATQLHYAARAMENAREAL